MSQHPWVVLVNPAAGGGRGARRGRRAIAALRQRGEPVHLVMGADAAEAEARASEAVASGARGLVVVGGDGVAHIGLNVAARADVPLGLVAAGSGNDFARALGVARLDVDRAVAAITAAELHGGQTIALGKLDSGRYFGSVLATGFDATVSARASRMRGLGVRARYPAAMLVELGAFRPIERTVVVDGVANLHRAMLVAVGKGPSYGGGMRICPTAALTSDTLHVTVIEEMTVPELLWLFPRVYKGTHIAHPKAKVYVGHRVSVAVPDDDRETPVIADGETIGAGSVSARVALGALRVLTPGLP